MCIFAYLDNKKGLSFNGQLDFQVGLVQAGQGLVNSNSCLILELIVTGPDESHHVNLQA